LKTAKSENVVGLMRTIASTIAAILHDRGHRPHTGCIVPTPMDGEKTRPARLPSATTRPIIDAHRPVKICADADTTALPLISVSPALS
jgi:hypothetical protein